MFAIYIHPINCICIKHFHLEAQWLFFSHLMLGKLLLIRQGILKPFKEQVFFFLKFYHLGVLYSLTDLAWGSILPAGSILAAIQIEAIDRSLDHDGLTQLTVFYVSLNFLCIKKKSSIIQPNIEYIFFLFHLSHLA